MKAEIVELIDRLINANIKRLLFAQVVAHVELTPTQILAMMTPIESEILLLKKLLTDADVL